MEPVFNFFLNWGMKSGGICGGPLLFLNWKPLFFLKFGVLAKHSDFGPWLSAAFSTSKPRLLLHAGMVTAGRKDVQVHMRLLSSYSKHTYYVLWAVWEWTV